MITADTITDDQIRELRDRIYDRVDRGVDAKDDRETHAMCESALNEMCNPQRRREARMQLAEILNARVVSNLKTHADAQMLITIRVHNVRVFDENMVEIGPHLRAVGYLPSGQVLIYGRIVGGHSPSCQSDAVKDVKEWLRTHREGWDIETLPGEGVLGVVAAVTGDVA